VLQFEDSTSMAAASLRPVVRKTAERLARAAI